ncbi:hypothetical protein FIBSPDRAFT_13474 [Athelia psychrophila]|uniref:Uncharacterized protein n=1 Tax=Athelia psychrophila TaxID=1759441 RepID=A0A166XCW3_9AGAM|nr:hypothetical protein FIBSPDRAFT_13474 [Fibularhizoctonia sp. CBS 109695]
MLGHIDNISHRLRSSAKVILVLWSDLATLVFRTAFSTFQPSTSLWSGSTNDNHLPALVSSAPSASHLLAGHQSDLVSLLSAFKQRLPASPQAILPAALSWPLSAANLVTPSMGAIQSAPFTRGSSQPAEFTLSHPLVS